MDMETQMDTDTGTDMDMDMGTHTDTAQAHVPALKVTPLFPESTILDFIIQKPIV